MSLLLAMMLACSTPADPDTQKGTSVVPDPTDSKTLPDRPDWLDDAHGSPLGEVDAPLPAADGRPLRRMDIDQLNASIRFATGGIGWEINGEDQFEDLASTLGRPDFAQTTAEDLTPGLLFQKFLDDAANAVCDELVATEAVGGPGNVFLVHVDLNDTSLSAPNKVQNNLQAALLRFHGNAIEDDDPQLEAWRWLFDTTVDVTGGDTLAGWRSVCIGLITHPDFAMY